MAKRSVNLYGPSRVEHFKHQIGRIDFVQVTGNPVPVTQDDFDVVAGVSMKALAKILKKRGIEPGSATIACCGVAL